MDQKGFRIVGIDTDGRWLSAENGHPLIATEEEAMAAAERAEEPDTAIIDVGNRLWWTAKGSRENLKKRFDQRQVTMGLTEREAAAA